MLIPRSAVTVGLSFLLLWTGHVHAFSPRVPSRLEARRRVTLRAVSPAEETTTSTSESASQNAFGVVSDAVTGSIFSLLHAFDPDPISDSSKNLRVLWVRAILNEANRIEDDIARWFLPPTTRGLVQYSGLFQPVLKFTEWIQARTEFIDNAMDHFLSVPSDESSQVNVVFFGAGYDTRVLRYRENKRVNFVEVDLPEVCKNKEILYNKFQKEVDPSWEVSKLVPLDLNDCESKVKLVDRLKTIGKLDPNLPTLFCFEAVLFYVNEGAVRNILQELFDYSHETDTMLVMTDSLKPYVKVPFSNEARQFFANNDMELLEHRARWGGAVHFCMATSSKVKKNNGISTSLGDHIRTRAGGIVNSYTPTASNNKAILKTPSFDNVWYAIAYPWQIDGYATPLDAVLNRKKNGNKPFATRLWGEPIVVYRDSKGELVAMADVCPHRSVPLSVGNIENGQLVCSYHGWKFGEGGACTDVPTLRAANQADPKPFLEKIDKAKCGNMRAVVEHEGIVYMWRGNVLEADVKLLPTRRKGDMESVPIDTVLDYNVDYSYIVENNLDSPHLFYLHDGSVPPIESIGMLNSNLPKLKLKYFTDDCGMGHLGSIEKDGRPKKLIRFDPPNIVRHGGVSGFEEEFHVVPIAPQRTRVLLRQHLPRGPILSTITSIPLVKPLLTLLVNNWNYHIGLEDANIMQGQANRIEDWGSPRMRVGGLGDDLIKRYWTWRSEAHKNMKDGTSPYYSEFSENGREARQIGIPSGTAFGDDPEVVAKVREDAVLRNTPIANDNQNHDGNGNMIGSWGIKFNYLQNTPAPDFPPTNYKLYSKLLVLDSLVKGIFATARKDECWEPTIPTQKKGVSVEKPSTEEMPDLLPTPALVNSTAAYVFNSTAA